MDAQRVWKKIFEPAIGSLVLITTPPYYWKGKRAIVEGIRVSKDGRKVYLLQVVGEQAFGEFERDEFELLAEF